MATLGGREFRLPSEFLSDILMDKENFTQHPLNTDLPSNLCFPSEFPYEFGSPVESVVGSTESESDEDDLIARLTRQLARSTLQGHQNISINSQNLEAVSNQKSWVLSGSPQSTLSAVGCWSGNGSPNGPSQAPSPPTTPYGGKEDSWDLIYAAAGQVAQLKMNNDLPANGRGPPVPPRSFTPAYTLPVTKPTNTGVYLNQCFPRNISQPHHFQQVGQKQSSVWGREAKEVWPSQQQVSRQNRASMAGIGVDYFVDGGKSGRPLGLSQSTWPPLKVEHQHRQNPPPQIGGLAMRVVSVGGSDTGLKRECAGTGVFLPRRYGNLNESRKKPGSPPLLQTRVVEAPIKNLDSITPNFQPKIQAHGRENGGSIPDYNALMARRNALLAQQRRSIRQEGAMTNEIRLPQEWTY